VKISRRAFREEGSLFAPSFRPHLCGSYKSLNPRSSPHRSILRQPPEPHCLSASLASRNQYQESPPRAENPSTLLSVSRGGKFARSYCEREVYAREDARCLLNSRMRRRLLSLHGLVRNRSRDPIEFKRTDSCLSDSSYPTSFFVQIGVPTLNYRFTPAKSEQTS